MVDGERLTFGFEGIWQGTAVLYDHQTRSLWMHVTGACFEGEHEGTVLARIPSGRHTTWGDWVANHPRTRVLQPDPALVMADGDRGYFPAEGAASGSDYLPSYFGATIQTRDPRFALHALVYGVVVGGQARAYPFHRLQNAPVVDERVGDVEVTVWFDPQSRSAAAFERTVDGRPLTFAMATPGRVRDAETGSTWDMEGHCLAGRLKGTHLKPLRGLMAEWYGWYANYPRTSVWGR